MVVSLSLEPIPSDSRTTQLEVMTSTLDIELPVPLASNVLLVRVLKVMVDDADVELS